MVDPSSPDRLDPDVAGAIIRRATELDQERDLGRPGIDRRALEAAAGEVGISPASVRRALAEHDAGALGPPEATKSVLGPARVRAVRTVDLPAHVCQEQVDRFLKSQMLEVHRRDGAEVEWRRRSDFGAKLRRKLDPVKRVRLTDIDGVIATVTDDGAGRSIVRLEADLSDTRDGLRTGVVLIPTAAGPVLGGAAALILAEPLVFAAGLPLGLAMGGTGVYVARRTLADELEESRRVLELFLDELDRGR